MLRSKGFLTQLNGRHSPKILSPKNFSLLNYRGYSNTQRPIFSSFTKSSKLLNGWNSSFFLNKRSFIRRFQDTQSSQGSSPIISEEKLNSLSPEEFYNFLKSEFKLEFSSEEKFLFRSNLKETFEDEEDQKIIDEFLPMTPEEEDKFNQDHINQNTQLLNEFYEDQKNIREERLKLEEIKRTKPKNIVVNKGGRIYSFENKKLDPLEVKWNMIEEREETLLNVLQDPDFDSTDNLIDVSDDNSLPEVTEFFSSIKEMKEDIDMNFDWSKNLYSDTKIEEKEKELDLLTAMYDYMEALAFRHELEYLTYADDGKECNKTCSILMKKNVLFLSKIKKKKFTIWMKM